MDKRGITLTAAPIAAIASIGTIVFLALGAATVSCAGGPSALDRCLERAGDDADARQKCKADERKRERAEQERRNRSWDSGGQRRSGSY